MDDVFRILGWCSLVGVLLYHYRQLLVSYWDRWYGSRRHVVGKPMNAIELNEVLQSDMKLWDLAEKSTNDKGQLVVKTELPHGIGEYVITFEGVDSGIKRRAAAEQWAANIRAAVEDVISEESVTARAQQAAALSSPDPDQLHALSGADREFAKEILDSSPVQAHEEALESLGEDPADRLAGLRSLCSEYTLFIESMAREIKALTAYVEVMDAYKNSEDSTGVGSYLLKSSDAKP